MSFDQTPISRIMKLKISEHSEKQAVGEIRTRGKNLGGRWPS